MRILIATDAWFPQVNGVVRSLSTVAGELAAMGHTIHTLTPDRFRTVPCPTYPEIRLAVKPYRRLKRLMDRHAPESIHIATEGPIGLAARRYCLRRGLAYTTSLHTRFPEYVNARTGIPVSWGYAFLRWFHGPAARIMVATGTLREELAAGGLPRTAIWSRGVNLKLFHPRPKNTLPSLAALPRPLTMYVGRVAVEKNIEAFLTLDLPGTKVVVGGGPMLNVLKRRYPDAVFTGNREGEELARHYAAADVFVFPSRTDTFGNVLLEALASGVPVAAYPVPGPVDVIGPAEVDGAPVGCLDEDLGAAVRRALKVPAQDCRRYAERFSWTESARQFLDNLVPVTPAAAAEPAAAPAAENANAALTAKARRTA